MPELTISDFLTKFQDVIKADAPLAAFATEKYGKAPFVFGGIDVTAPPNESTMPHIILLPGDPSRSGGVEDNETVFRVDVLFAVKDEGVTYTDNGMEADGVKNCDRFGALTWDAVKGFSSNCPASRVDYTIEGAAFVPIFPGTMTIEIHVPRVMGGTRTI